MKRWESVQMLHCAANISEKILFDKEGTQRSDEQIRFILHLVNDAVRAAESSRQERSEVHMTNSPRQEGKSILVATTCMDGGGWIAKEYRTKSADSDPRMDRTVHDRQRPL